MASSSRLRLPNPLEGAGEQSDMVRYANVRHDSRASKQRSDRGATSFRSDNTPLPSDLPAVARKKASVAIDGDLLRRFTPRNDTELRASVPDACRCDPRNGPPAAAP